MESYTFIFFGIVGSGKGTQVKLLQDLLKAKDGKECVYAYPGNEYRKIIKSGTQTASLVKDILNKGGLQPNSLTNSVFVSILIPAISPDKHLIVDGYPRTIFQAECFEEVMKFYQRSDVKIIYLEVNKEEVIKRMKLRGRHDDTDEGIARRFDEYEKNVIPAMNYFKSKSGYEIYKVNGEQSVEAVHTDIKKALNF
jgi:adenylate kinase